VRQAVQGLDKDGSWIYVTAMADSSIERHLYRVRPDGSGFARITKKPGTHRISMSSDARFLLDTFSDIRTLPALTLHRASGEEVACWRRLARSCSRRSTCATPNC